MNKRLNATLTIGGAVASSLRSAFGTTSGEVDRIGSAISRLKDRQKELNRTISDQAKLGRGANALVAGYAQDELDEVARKLEKLRQLQERVNNARSGMAAGKAQMAAGGGLLGGALAAAAVVGAPLALASKRAGEFEYQLQMIGNTADMTKADIQALGAQILETSKYTGQSAEDTVRGIGFLVAAGMDVKTAAETVKQAGLAATASGGDIEDLARAAFTLNDAFKIQPGEAMAAALDTLSQAGKEGNVELKDMAKQLPVLGSGFVALKMEGREAAATMAAALEVARKGAADADEAANNMKNFIAKIMSPDTLKKAQKSFGIDLYKIITDAQTQGKNPFEAAMSAVIKATQGDQKKIGELFGDMQVQNFVRPMIQNWEEYIRIKDKALNASGVVDRDAEKIRETQKQQIAEAENALGRLGIAVGGLLAPAVTAVAQALVPVITGIGQFIMEHKTLVTNLALAVGTVGAVVAGFGSLKIGIGAVVVAFHALKLAIATNPIGLIVTALAVGAVLIYKNWEPIKAFFGDVWAGIKAGATIAWEYLSKVWLNFTPLGLVVKNWGPIKDWFTGLFSDIEGSAKKAFEWILSKIETLGGFWTKTKSLFGFGSSAPTQVQPPTVPNAPAIATSRGGVQLTDNSQNTIQIVQQPGENSDDLARRVDQIMKDRETKQRRGALYDPAMGY